MISTHLSSIANIPWGTCYKQSIMLCTQNEVMGSTWNTKQGFTPHGSLISSHRANNLSPPFTSTHKLKNSARQYRFLIKSWCRVECYCHCVDRNAHWMRFFLKSAPGVSNSYERAISHCFEYFPKSSTQLNQVEIWGRVCVCKCPGWWYLSWRRQGLQTGMFTKGDRFSALAEHKRNW